MSGMSSKSLRFHARKGHPCHSQKHRRPHPRSGRLAQHRSHCPLCDARAYPDALHDYALALDRIVHFLRHRPLSIPRGERVRKPRRQLNTVEDRREHARRVEAWTAVPVDRPVGADERDGVQVADQAVLGDGQISGSPNATRSLADVSRSGRGGRRAPSVSVLGGLWHEH